LFFHAEKFVVKRAIDFPAPNILNAITQFYLKIF